MIFLFVNFSLQMWTCGLRSWGDLMGILKKLLDSEQESSGLQSLLFVLFNCLCINQHFILETAAWLGSTHHHVTESRATAPPLIWALSPTAHGSTHTLLHFRKQPHWIQDPTEGPLALSFFQTGNRGNYFSLSFQSGFQKQRQVEVSSYRNGQKISSRVIFMCSFLWILNKPIETVSSQTGLYTKSSHNWHVYGLQEARKHLSCFNEMFKHLKCTEWSTTQIVEKSHWVFFWI